MDKNQGKKHLDLLKPVAKSGYQHIMLLEKYQIKRKGVLLWQI